MTHLQGTAADDNLVGSAFNDELDGGLGNDTLYGAGGNDTLRGGPGSDTYYFGRGDGQDVIEDAYMPGEQDRLQLGAGISLADVTLSVDNNGDLIVTIKNSGDTVRLRGYTYAAPAERPLIVFADGTTLDGLAVEQALFGGSGPRYGTPDADAMVGSAFSDELDGGLGNDALYGGAGNDTLRGGPGSDTYYFGRGDGQDVIEDGSEPGEQDRLQLGAGISLADVSLRIDNSGDLIVTLKNSSDTVRLRGYTYGDPMQRPLIVFADGTTLDGLAVEQALFSSGSRYGTPDADAMVGSAFSDELDGGLGNDALYGGGGNDTLRGGPGSDTYYFGRGDGQDVIEDASQPGEQDRVQLGAGISLADVTLSVDNGDLIVAIKNSSDTVRLSGYTYTAPTERPLIVFADGTTLDGFAVEQALFGGSRDGTAGADAMVGSAFSDELDGGLGNDALYGGAGNDTLRGGPGSDTYYFGRGDGQDVIEDFAMSGEQGRLRLGAGISLADVSLSLDNGDLIVTLKNSSDTVRLQGYTYGDPTERPLIVFADGTTLDGFAVDQALFGGDSSRYGTPGADAMVGSAFNDELDGGLGNDALYGAGGNDTLRGGPGSDTYYFGRGDGQDVIEDAPAAPGEQDRLQLGAGISLADVSLSLDNGDLVITVKNSSETVRLRGYTYSGPMERPLIVFADGTTLDGLAVEQALFNGGGSRYGTMGTDAMVGGAFSDEFDGGLGNDALYGGGGNDTLRGGPGSDTYYFGRGDGQDVIEDASQPGEQDRLRLGAGISLADVSLSVDNSGDLIVTLKNSSDTVRLRGYTYGDPMARPLIVFADGTTLDGLAVDQALFSGGDSRYGTPGADAMVGGAFHDQLDGGLGNDALYGAGGNDTLRGGPGSDTYYFGRGDGQDVIEDAPAAPGEQDRLRLGAGISLADVSLSVDNNGDLIVAIKNSSDTVRLRGYTYSGPMERPLIVFADGTALDGFAVEQALFGGGGPRYGTPSADAMVGSAFNDELDGGLGNDALYGAGGNDTLRGGPGSDTYYFGRGDGQDVIEDASAPDGQDRLQLGAGISLADVSLSLDNDDLIVTIKNSSDTVRLRHYTYGDPMQRPLIVFADGATLDGLAVEKALFGGSGPRYGTPGADAMVGGTFNDELDGGLGNDALYGAGGNDTLRGGPGSDTYYFGRGDGQDVIEDASPPGEQDRLQLGAGISLADVSLSVDNGDLVVTLKNSSDTVRLRGYTYSDPMQRPLIVFADGSTLDGIAVDRALFGGSGSHYGTRGADVMVGSAYDEVLDGGLGNDALYGAGGNDTLRGGPGSDTYHFGRGDGQDLIEDAPAAPGEQDRVQLAAGIVKSDISVRQFNGKLILELGADTLTVADYFMLPESERPQIVFSDGSIWSTEEIKALLNHAPVVSTPLADQFARENELVIFKLPAQAFKDSDQGDGLSYSATLADGSALPSWLTFNASTGEFSGQPPVGSVGSLNVLVNATDRSGASVSDDFKLVIATIPEMLGTGSANTLTGTPNAERLTGLGGNDTLIGGGGADILDGGTGNDRMRGGTGDDLYIVNAGDEIIEYASEGIDSVQSSISHALYSNVENLWLLGTGNLSGTGNSLANSLRGNGGANSLSGAAGHDTLDGGAGNDTLAGGTGNDTYMLGRGHGRDVINENDATSGNTDVLQAGADIAADQLWFSRNGNDLEVTVIGTTDKMVVSNWYAGSQYQVEQFKSGDGQILLASQVNALVNAMASFAPPPAGQTTLPAGYQDTLNPVLAASWN